MTIILPFLFIIRRARNKITREQAAHHQFHSLGSNDRPRKINSLGNPDNEIGGEQGTASLTLYQQWLGRQKSPFKFELLHCNSLTRQQSQHNSKIAQLSIEKFPGTELQITEAPFHKNLPPFAHGLFQYPCLLISRGEPNPKVDITNQTGQIYGNKIRIYILWKKITF